MDFICEKCKNMHDGLFGSGRFCSKSCANSRQHSHQTKMKISKSQQANGGFVSQDHKEKFLELGRLANAKWRQDNFDSLMSADFGSLKFARMKKRIVHEQGLICNRCGLSEWLGEPIPLEIEHKDGNHQNNVRDNLEALCPNCHSLTDTWRGRNKTKDNSNKNKISDEELVDAFLATGNIRQCLIRIGLAPKGTNYGRVKRCLSIRGIAY